MQMFFTFVLNSLWLLKLKTEGRTIYRKRHRKVTKPKSKFYLIGGKLDRALNNPLQELRFEAGLNLYITSIKRPAPFKRPLSIFPPFKGGCTVKIV